MSDLSSYNHESNNNNQSHEASSINDDLNIQSDGFSSQSIQFLTVNNNLQTSLEATLLSLHTLISKVSHNVDDLVNENKILNAKFDSQNERLDLQCKRLEEIEKSLNQTSNHMNNATSNHLNIADAIFDHDDNDADVDAITPIKKRKLQSDSNENNSDQFETINKKIATNNSENIIRSAGETDILRRRQIRQRDTLKRKFEFQIPNVKIKKIQEESTPISSQKSYKNSARFVSGDFMPVFEEQLKLCENTDKICVQKRHGVIYTKPTKGKTNYLRINGDCKLCDQRTNKETAVKYIFTIAEKPSDSAIYANVNCVIIGEHDHSAIEATKQQIRGAKRAEIAAKIRMAGGAHAYGLELARTQPDGKHPSDATLRKIVSTEKNKNNKSSTETEWIQMQCLFNN